jgi:hypothetical protein
MVEEQTEKNNWLVKWFKNLRNTKKNFQKVRASPYASLNFTLKVRKIIIACLIPWLCYMTYSMVTKIRANGMMRTIQTAFTMKKEVQLDLLFFYLGPNEFSLWSTLNNK